MKFEHTNAPCKVGKKEAVWSFFGVQAVLFVMRPEAEYLDAPIWDVHVVDQTVLNVEPTGINVLQPLELFAGGRVLEGIFTQDVQQLPHLVPQMGGTATVEMFQGLACKAYLPGQRSTSDSGTQSSQEAARPSLMSRTVPGFEKRYTVSMSAL